MNGLTDGHKYTNAILRYLVKINSYKHIFGIERPLCKVDECPYRVLRYLVKINSYKHIFGIERPLCKVDECPYSG